MPLSKTGIFREIDRFTRHTRGVYIYRYLLLILLATDKGAGWYKLRLFPSFFTQGTKMELPLWLAKGLYERKRRVVSIELPKVYREGWRTVFNADPTVVDLHKMGPYYYGLGSQMLHFDSPENPEIAQALLQVNGLHKWCR